MRSQIVVGLVGDRSESVVAHTAIPRALDLAARALDVDLVHRWIPTEQVWSVAPLAGLDGLWCVPGGPYRSMAGALFAIRHAREQGIPFLGTCAGFQHAVVEYACNVLGLTDAAHAEVSPDATQPVIAPLSCGILEGEGSVRLIPGTQLAAAYGAEIVHEEYLCSYGVNPDFRAMLESGPLRAAATDELGDLRAVELDGHPFFVATLFQPERAALRGRPVPPVHAFVRACACRSDRSITCR